MTHSEEFDCRRCGACCISFHDQDGYCNTTPKDEKKLGKRFVRLNIIRPNPIQRLVAELAGVERVEGLIRTAWRKARTGPLRGYEILHCAALRGSPMSRVSCTIYENRPKICKLAVKPGDRNCKEVRRMLFDAIERRDDEGGVG